MNVLYSDSHREILWEKPRTRTTWWRERFRAPHKILMTCPYLVYLTKQYLNMQQNHLYIYATDRPPVLRGECLVWTAGVPNNYNPVCFGNMTTYKRSSRELVTMYWNSTFIVDEILTWKIAWKDGDGEFTVSKPDLFYRMPITRLLDY